MRESFVVLHTATHDTAKYMYALLGCRRDALFEPLDALCMLCMLCMVIGVTYAGRYEPTGEVIASQSLYADQV